MNIKTRDWIVFILIAVIALGVWYKLSYPQFLFVDLKVTRQEALKEAENYLSRENIDTSSHLKSAVFMEDSWADRYLQKTLGFKEEDAFVKNHDYELFSWIVRFFRENEKEEYFLEVSSKSGDIISLNHLIKDTETRQTKDKKNSKVLAEKFLKNKFDIDFAEYDFHEEHAKKFDNRTDYEFSWEKKGVYIPWGDEEDAGGAKLLTGATVSGKEVRDFYKIDLDIPEKFTRYIHNQMILGNYISSIFQLIFFGWIAWAIYIIVRRKKDVVIRKSCKYLISLGVTIFVLSIIYALNNFQGLMFVYPTSSFLTPFVGLHFINIALNYIFVATALIAAGLAAESLRYEVFPKNKLSSFFHYINSSLWTRSTSKLILFGYISFFILLGLQSSAFYFGQKYLGVWVERIRLTELSSAYIPFLTAFIIAFRAAFSEEIVYRMFGISWAKKYLKSTFLAVLITSLVWGFSHTQYLIFPVWFRGIEVTIIGIFFALIFLRYGIIPALIAHYLFDVFWGVAAYILGNTTPYLFLSSVFIMIIPLILAAVCCYLNREEKERKLEIVLSANQKYNLDILLTYLNEKKKNGVPSDAIKQELISYGWDQILVELALKKVYHIK